MPIRQRFRFSVEKKKVDRVKMAVGQILYIPSARSWTAICSSLRRPRGLSPVLPKKAQNWPKHVDGHPHPCVVEIRLWRITFTPSARMDLDSRGCSDRRPSFYELLARSKFVWMPSDYPERWLLLSSLEVGVNQETASTKRVESPFLRRFFHATPLYFICFSPRRKYV